MSEKLWPAIYSSILISIVAIVMLGKCFKLSWNLTPSLPLGIYRVEKVDVASMKGKVVSFCPPNNEIFRIARDQGILKWGRCPFGFAPLLKRVVGVPGDVVRVDNRVTINGKSVNHGSLVKEVASIFKSTRLARILTDQELWVMGDTADSFDSRYFGAIPVGVVIGQHQLVF